jgi:hypothetical protein
MPAARVAPMFPAPSYTHARHAEPPQSFASGAGHEGMLGSLPAIPVIPPLLPSGEAIALEPARFDPPSLAALRGDVQLPHIGQPPSSRTLVPEVHIQRNSWIAFAIASVMMAFAIVGLAVYFSASR